MPSEGALSALSHPYDGLPHMKVTPIGEKSANFAVIALGTAVFG